MALSVGQYYSQRFTCSADRGRAAAASRSESALRSRPERPGAYLGGCRAKEHQVLGLLYRIFRTALEPTAASAVAPSARATTANMAVMLRLASSPQAIREIGAAA